MRSFVLALAATAAIISGCRDNTGVRGYWSSRELDIDNYATAEEEFTDFVELAYAAPQKDAFAAVDMLLKKARKDDVTYLVYADLILKGFSSIGSPCRSCPIFIHAADNMLSHGIPSGDMTIRYQKRRELCMHNGVGDIAELPDLIGSSKPDPCRRTVILIVDQDCPSCLQSMERFSSEKWEGTALVALCYGHGPLPESPGWECYTMSRQQGLIDTREAPLFYVISPEGKVEISYTSVYDEDKI